MAANDQKRSPYDRYRDYVLQLEQAGKKFPVNQFGDINYSKIADECGNRRQWFSESAKKVFCPQGQTLEQVIKKDIRRLGSEFVAAKDPESVLVDMADSKSREANRLRSMLEQKSKENELLREQVERLSAELRLLRTSAEEISSQQDLMMDSGRSFIL
jgi:predicted RNase H-like nuclease (RuvC/YqgF family)